MPYWSEYDQQILPSTLQLQYSNKHTVHHITEYERTSWRESDCDDSFSPRRSTGSGIFLHPREVLVSICLQVQPPEFHHRLRYRIVFQVYGYDPDTGCHAMIERRHYCHYCQAYHIRTDVHREKDRLVSGTGGFCQVSCDLHIFHFYLTYSYCSQQVVDVMSHQTSLPLTTNPRMPCSSIPGQANARKQKPPAYKSCLVSILLH